VLLAVLLMSGCSGRYCERSAPVYEKSVESAPLTAPEGLQVPKQDPNLAIPEATGPDVPYAQKEEGKGKKRTRCLDMPPELPRQEVPADS
jgi:uncharacterized lipoprotein